MAKYLKHYYVESDNHSEFLLYNNNFRTGKTHPPLTDLDVKIWCNEPSSVDYCLSVCPDTTSVPSVSGIQQITFEQWTNEAETHFNLLKPHLIELVSEQTEKDRIGGVSLDKSSVDSIVSSFGALSPVTHTLPL
jgi:hypothetical protein